MKKILFTLFLPVYLLSAQDTTVVQTLTFDSTGRDYTFSFPSDPTKTYERIVMEYRMRCTDGLVSTGTDRNKGCGEWDYSCNTYITDSSYTDSVKSTHPSHIISGFTGSNFNFTTLPTFNYYQYTQKNVSYTTTTSETTAIVGSGTENLNHPFGTSNKTSKSHYLWTAAELSSAGLTANNITGMRLNVSTNSDDARYVRIRLKNSSKTTLSTSSPDLDGFTEVYFLNTSFSNGLNEFKFYNNFAWNGTSNIVVEISYTNSVAGSDNIVIGHNTGSNMGLISAGNDYSLEFTGSEHINLPTTAFNTINNEITVSMWCYGNPDIMPANSYAFEGVDNANNRQANVHLPWSNGSVYWDCGGVGGNYDRIDKAATALEYEGKWNHWAFTKNASTGNMRIYLNGSLWHSGNAKTNAIDIKKMIVGASANLNGKYYGKIDEFRVWDTELTQTEISDWMYKKIDNSHSSYSNLVALYDLNEGTGNTTIDASINAETGNINGLSNWSYVRGKDLYKQFSETTFRPNITFVQGVYTTNITDTLVYDTIQNNQTSIAEYQVNNNNLSLTSTQYVWAGGYEYLFDGFGTKLDSFAISTSNSVSISELVYFNTTPSDFEIMSFVTPYGIGLDFGMEGKMWTFDVSDYGPILKGNKRLFLTGGVNQEELDIRFLFIEGTPPRKVEEIQQLWKVAQRSYTDIVSDKYFYPKNVKLNASATNYKVKTAITGHGQEGEFIARNHYINVDGGANELEWLVWKECSDNPVPAQGGTWIYDRAGWCPGAATDIEELVITNASAIPGNNLEIDYGLKNGASGDSRYIVNSQLVSYGDPSHTLDARIVEVQRPTKRVEFAKINPECMEPTIVIQNTGSTNLTSLKIEYNVKGNTKEVYNWSGNLAFLETEVIVLPLPDSKFWLSNNTTFEAEISNPNGGVDEYANNNYYSSEFEKATILGGDISIDVTTNKKANETSYTLVNMYGDTIIEHVQKSLSASTSHIDQITLPVGCYTLDVRDDMVGQYGQNGLGIWFLASHGEGDVYIKDGTKSIYIDPDFGMYVRYSFSVGDIYASDIPMIKEGYRFLNVSPNPAYDRLNIELHGYENQDLLFQVYDSYGKLVLVKNVHSQSNILNRTLNISNFESGTYLLKIISEEGTKTKKFIKL